MPRLIAALRTFWTRARWSAASRPSLRQLLALLAFSALLCLPNLRLLARPYVITELCAYDDYWLLKGLDAGHSLSDAVGWFHGDWPEHNRFYRPLAAVSLWLDYLLYGWNPYPYRVTNLILYALTAVVLGLFVSVFTRRRDFAVASVAIFCLYPQSGSQAVIVTFNPRGDLLCGLFYLAALYCAVRHARYREVRYLAWFALCLALALLSKEMALSLPLVATVTLLLTPRLPLRRALRPIAVLLAASVVVGLCWYLAYRHAVPARLASGSPQIIASTWLMCAGTMLEDLTVLGLWVRSAPYWADFISCYVPTSLLRLGVWIAALVFIARRQWRFVAYFLLWGILTWLPLITTHTQAPHYAYLPQLNRAIVAGPFAVMVIEASRQKWETTRNKKSAEISAPQPPKPV
ncbi:MAG: hypothetical protein ABFE07_12790 [Armatimonadia bacterium]